MAQRLAELRQFEVSKPIDRVIKGAISHSLCLQADLRAKSAAQPVHPSMSAIENSRIKYDIVVAASKDRVADITKELKGMGGLLLCTI